GFFAVAGGESSARTAGRMVSNRGKANNPIAAIRSIKNSLAVTEWRTVGVSRLVFGLHQPAYAGRSPIKLVLLGVLAVQFLFGTRTAVAGQGVDAFTDVFLHVLEAFILDRAVFLGEVRSHHPLRQAAR